MSQAAFASNPRFNYSDYVNWPEGERWELIGGEPYCMSPAPSQRHQGILIELIAQFRVFLRDKDCRLFAAPSDVRLPEPDESLQRSSNVVQPDLFVVCDQTKLDGQNCNGAPDFIIEIISPSTGKKDELEKAALYERHGVKEYWTIHPDERLIIVRLLGDDGKWRPAQFHPGENTLEVKTLPGLSVDWNLVFGPPPPAKQPGE